MERSAADESGGGGGAVLREQPIMPANPMSTIAIRSDDKCWFFSVLSVVLSALLRGGHFRLFVRRQGFQQSPYLIQYLSRLRGLKRKAKNSLGCKLRAFLGILRDQLHQPARVNIGLAGKAYVELIALAIYLRHPD